MCINERVKNEAIAELAKPMSSLFAQLSRPMANGEYQGVVAEGTSARIPGLVMTEALLLIPAPDMSVKFVTSVRRNPTNVRESIQKITKDSPGRWLILTEYMHSGKTVSALSSIFGNLGVSLDVMALWSVYGDAYYKESGVISDSSKLFIGHEHSRQAVNSWIFSEELMSSRRGLQPKVYGNNYLNHKLWPVLSCAPESVGNLTLVAEAESISTDIKALAAIITSIERL